MRTPRLLARCKFVGLDEGGDAGDFFADHQFVDVVGAFVGVDGFEIVHVAHDAVVVDDAVGAEDVAGFARGFESDATLFIFSIEMCVWSTLPLSLRRPTWRARVGLSRFR